MNKPIRVAHVIGKLSAGGVEAVINNYYRNIDHSKIQFDYIIDADSNYEPPQELIDMGARYYVVPPYQSIFQYMKALIRIFKENKYQIIHVSMNTLSVFSLCAAWIAGVPVRINHNHSTAHKSEGKRIILKYILKPFAKVFATDYVACSEHAGRWLFGNKLYDKGKVTVFNNAIDLDRFFYDMEKRQEFRNKLSIEDTDYVIGHVGRFMLQKNHEFIIDIFYKISLLDKNAKLLLIGNGELFTHISNKVEKLQLKNKVIFIGNVQNVEDYYQVMDVFLFPSIFEGLGMVVIEAQATGLPVVASNEVPKIVKVSDNISFLNLNDTLDSWVREVLSYYDIKRENNKNRINECGYNIVLEAKKLEKYYLKKIL